MLPYPRLTDKKKEVIKRGLTLATAEYPATYFHKNKGYCILTRLKRCPCVMIAFK